MTTAPIINLTLNVTPEILKLLQPILALATATTPEDEPEFISIKEATDRCPYSYKTVYGWIVHKKQIHCKQPGGRKGKRLVRLKDFDRLISEKLGGGSSLPRSSKSKKTLATKGGCPRRKPKTFA